MRVIYTVVQIPSDGGEPVTKTLELPPSAGPILMGCSRFVFEGETYKIASSGYDLDASILTIDGGEQSG